MKEQPRRLVSARQGKLRAPVDTVEIKGTRGEVIHAKSFASASELISSVGIRTAEWSPPAHVRDAMEDIVKHNRAVRVYDRLGAGRIKPWLEKHDVVVSTCTISRWMQKRMQHE